jgi:hypothetical protein
MAKQTAEGSNRLSIFWLKKHGFLPVGGSYRYGGIEWTHGWSENKSSIGFTVITNGSEDDNIKLQYVNTSTSSGEKENIEYKVSLATTACNYGGKRYWFICPLSKNGRYCGRRVGVFFGIGKWFGCRHCGQIAYNSQMQGGRYKGFVSIPDIDRAEEKVKRYYYKGKPTRKYRKVIRLNEKFENGFIMMAARLGKLSGRLSKPKK